MVSHPVMYPPAKVPDLRHGERGYCGPPQTQIGEFVMVRLSAMLKKNLAKAKICENGEDRAEVRSNVHGEL
jgi:hypothetical protein